MYAKPEPYICDRKVEDAISDQNFMKNIKQRIVEGEIVIFKNFVTSNEIELLKSYLHNIQRSSLPEFVPILEGAKNNYRINFSDPRSPIPAFFHVWSFYNWNQDLFSLYDRYRDIFRLRNIIAGLPEDTFLNMKAEHGCAARLSVQFYPCGKGFFTAHEDPYDIHQLVVPIMAMSRKGDEFYSGGNFVRTGPETFVNTEDFVEPGDIVLFNTLCEHGVAPIDENDTFDPLSPKGRWMMLFAVNKTADNTKIGDAILK